MVSEGIGSDFDPRMLTFSQAQGYENLPRPLKFEELPKDARTRIWNVFYSFMTATSVYHEDFGQSDLGDDWGKILYETQVDFDIVPLDKVSYDLDDNLDSIRKSINESTFNKVFDLIQFVLRHASCPTGFFVEMGDAFVSCRLAYTIDEGPPPTIIPSVTPIEGKTIIKAMETLRKAGLGGSAEHLRKASECINGQDWAGSVRESIHAVESVARQLDPKSSTLGQALASLERSSGLHHGLKKSFSSLYGYTSNEQGIRHALFDQDSANVGMDEAVFMLGACASFCSYLWRKHKSGAT